MSACKSYLSILFLGALLFSEANPALADEVESKSTSPKGQNILADDLIALWVCGEDIGVFPIVTLESDRLALWDEKSSVVHFDGRNTFSIFKRGDFYQIRTVKNGRSGELSYVANGDVGQKRCFGWSGAPPETFETPLSAVGDVDGLFQDSNGWEDLLIFIWVQLLAVDVLKEELKAAQREVKRLQRLQDQ